MVTKHHQKFVQMSGVYISPSVCYFFLLGNLKWILWSAKFFVRLWGYHKNMEFDQKTCMQINSIKIYMQPVTDSFGFVSTIFLAWVVVHLLF